MNKIPANTPRRPRANSFETLIALVLFILMLIFLGAAAGFGYRLIVAGWRAADFIFNAF